MKERKKKKKKILIILLVTLPVLAVGVFLYYKFCMDPYRGTNFDYVESLPLETSLTAEQVSEDIDYVMKRLKTRHPAWLEDDNQRVKDVEAQYELEMEQIRDKASLSVLEELQIISRIMNRLHDGHTCVYAEREDSLYIHDFTELWEYGTPIKINGEPTKDILDRFLGLYQYEREEYAVRVFEDNVIYSEQDMKLLDIDTSHGVTFTYDTDEGEKEYHYSFVRFEDVKMDYEYSDSDEAPNWVDYKIDKENGVGIFVLEECNYNAEYRNMVKEFFTAVDASGIENIIVDLRLNGGGNSMVADEFLHYLDIDGYYTWADQVRYGNFLWKHEKRYIKNERENPVFSGKIYVLTDLSTFSAAMDFAMYIADNDLGVLVGEASGNLPEAYGDLLQFITPNAKLTFSVSYKKWFRIDESKSGEPLTPDIVCDPAEAKHKAYEIISESTSE